MYRVLKRGGFFVFVVWCLFVFLFLLFWVVWVFKGRVPDAHQPPLARVTLFGQFGVLDQLLNDAGFRNYEITPRRFDYRFASFDEYWDLMEASDILKQQFNALPAAQRDTVRDEIARFACEFQTDRGLVIP